MTDLERDRDNVPDDRLIEGVWVDPDETDSQRRNDEMSRPDFEGWAA